MIDKDMIGNKLECHCGKRVQEGGTRIQKLCFGHTLIVTIQTWAPVTGRPSQQPAPMLSIKKSNS